MLSAPTATFPGCIAVQIGESGTDWPTALEPRPRAPVPQPMNRAFLRQVLIPVQYAGASEEVASSGLPVHVA